MYTPEFMRFLDDMGLSTEEKRKRLLEINARATPEVFDLEYALIARQNAIRRNDHRAALLWDKEIAILKGEI